MPLTTPLKLLHVQASPRGDRSHSGAAARAFLADLDRVSENLRVRTRDVWSDLPDLDGAALDAKYARLAGQNPEGSAAEAWRRIDAVIDEIREADAVLISTPMWNLGLPYRLKHWFDLVTQPGLSVSFTPGVGYKGLIADRPVVCILSSAGDFTSGESYGRPDLASEYLRQALAFIGLTDLSIVRVGPTLAPEPDIAAGRCAALAELGNIAASLGKVDA